MPLNRILLLFRTAHKVTGRAEGIQPYLPQPSTFAFAPRGHLIYLSCFSTSTKARKCPQRSGKLIDSQSRGTHPGINISFLPARPAATCFSYRALARLPRRASAPSEAANYSTDRAGGRSRNPWKNYHTRTAVNARLRYRTAPSVCHLARRRGCAPRNSPLAFMSFPHHRKRNKRRKITMYYLVPRVLCCSTQLQPSAIHYNNVIILCLDQQVIENKNTISVGHCSDWKRMMIGQGGGQFELRLTPFESRKRGFEPLPEIMSMWAGRCGTIVSRV